MCDPLKQPRPLSFFGREDVPSYGDEWEACRRSIEARQRQWDQAYQKLPLHLRLLARLKGHETEPVGTFGGLRAPRP